MGVNGARDDGVALIIIEAPDFLAGFRVQRVHHTAARGDEFLLAVHIDDERGAEREFLLGLRLPRERPAHLAGGFVEGNDLGLRFSIGIEDEEVFKQHGTAAIAMNRRIGELLRAPEGLAIQSI